MSTLEEIAGRLAANAAELERLQTLALATMEAYRDLMRPTVALLRRIARTEYDYTDVWANVADRGGAWLRGEAHDIFCFGLRGFPRHLGFAATQLLERTRQQEKEPVA
jgi:hypothetical protein